MVLKKLKKGLVVKNSETLKRGAVLDWGVERAEFKRYAPLTAADDTADAVRVWTSSSVEIWPLAAVVEERR